jgi:photosystem II stability/assembly factor-like uncharacterized protein
VPDAQAGTTWAIERLVVAPDAVATLFAAGSVREPPPASPQARPCLLASEDGGASWRALQAGLGEVAVTSLSVGWSSGGTGRPLLVGAAGGLYRSKDAGRRWEQLVRGLPRELRARAVAIAPHASSEHMLAVAEAGQVLVSHDGGGSWEESAGAEGQPSALHLSSARCLLQTEAGLFRSADAGRTWQKLSTHGAPPGRGALAVCEAAPDVVCAITKREGDSQVVRSLDGGVTWSALPGTEGALDVELDPERRDTLYVLSGRGESSLLVTRDGGLTWSAVGGRVAASELVLVKTSPRTLFAVDRAGGPLRELHVDPAPQ